MLPSTCWSKSKRHLFLSKPGFTHSFVWSSVTFQTTLTCLAGLLFTLTAFAQQAYIGRYDDYIGFSYASSPELQSDRASTSKGTYPGRRIRTSNLQSEKPGSQSPGFG